MDINTTNSVIAVISFLLGVVVGAFGSNILRNKFKPTSYKNAVLMAVLIMWTISVGVEIVNPAYKTNPFIHGLMGSIVGFFYRFQPKE